MPGVTDDWNYSEMRNDSDYKRLPGMSPHRSDEYKGRKSSYSNGYSSDQQSDSNDEGPFYLLEHLATFTVSSVHGIVTPADGMRRLLHMEKTSGIWTQKMQMRLEKKWVVIIDLENGDIVERFPHQLLSDPTAFTSSDPKELYNNILVFIVREDPEKKNLTPSEMHIFQCVQISAQEVVDDIKMVISGKWRAGVSRDQPRIPPPPTDPAPEPPLNGQPRINVREQVSRFDAAAAAISPQSSEPQQRSQSQHQNHRSEMRSELRTNYVRDNNEDSESNSSEKYERDVAILNHCFDDIERFIARLQHAAAAFRELERRRKTRKSKKKDLGDGMLSMRAKPPPEREFVDIFQKFKLSFNLLAKLKSHIHDPNAPELVHFLFTPLTLIVDASRDSNYGPNLPSKVITPLLTRDAMDLLQNCLTSKESELWHSLGESWLIPRDQWKGYTSAYHPVFMDGWSPEYSFSDDKERSELASNSASAVQRAEYRDQDFHPGPSSREDARYSKEYYYSSDRERDRSSLAPLLPPPHEVDRAPPLAYENRHYESRQVVERQQQESRKHSLERERPVSPPSERDYPSDREYRREIDRDYLDRDYRGPEYRMSMERDYRSDLERDYRGPTDRVDVRSDFSADSIERTGSPGPGPGPLPSNSSHQFERQQRQWVEELRSRGSKIVQVTYPRTANNDKEMTVVRGEFLEIIDDSRKWWKARNVCGQVGHVPHTIVSPYQGNDDEIFNNPLYSSRGGPPVRDPYYGLSDSPRDRSDDSNYDGRNDGNPQGISSRSPVPASADWIRKERQGKKGYESPEDTADHGVPPLPSSLASKEIPQGDNNADKTSRSNCGSSCGNDVPRGRTTQEILNEELKLKMNGGSMNLVGNRNRSSQVYITARATASEIKQWLILKDFSQETVETLDGVTGPQIFLFSKAHFEEMCGKEEGSRLGSQIRIQKTTCGYNTVRKRGEELSSILARRKEELEKKEQDKDDFSITSANIGVDDAKNPNNKNNSGHRNPIDTKCVINSYKSVISSDGKAPMKNSFREALCQQRAKLCNRKENTIIAQ